MEPREAGHSAAGPSKPLHDPLLLSSCVSCGQLHPPEDALDFSPVCAGCSARRSILRSLEMSGPYPLSDEAIDDELSRKSPGNYALGYMDDTAFVVFYVGRSDSDVGHQLHDWVGAPSRYDRYAPAGKAAWASRCGGPMPVSTPMLGRVQAGSDSSYTHFAYSYAPSAAAAFDQECRNYDDFGGSRQLDNEGGPAQRQSRETELRRIGPA